MMPQQAFAENNIETSSKAMTGILSNGDLLAETGMKKASILQQGEEKKGRTYTDSDISNVISNGELDNIVDTLTDLDRLGTNDKQITVNVKDYGITLDNISRAVQYIFNCSPELFHFTNVYKYTYRNNNVTSMTFLLNDSVNEIKRKVDVIESEIKKFDQLVEPDMDEEDIILLVHDYLATTVVYDIDGLESGAASDSIYDIYGVFGEKLAVCQGYAMAAEYLLNRYGIECGIASSDNVHHAWNVVEIGGKWYHMDVTWDDPVHDNLGRVLHQYLLISDNELFSKSQGAQKRDYRTSDRGQKFDGAYSNAYKNKYWKKSKTKIHYFAGDWYYMNSNEFQLCKFDKSTNKSQVIVDNSMMPQDVVWKDISEPGSFWSENLSRVTGSGKLLYFSTPKNIFCVDLTDPNYEPRSVFNVGNTKKQIFGLGMCQNHLIYVLKDSPISDKSEIDNNMIYNTEISAVCQTVINKIETNYNQATIYFKPVNLVYDDGKKVPIQYQVFYKKNIDNKYKCITESKTKTTLDNLTENYKYSVKVRPFYTTDEGEQVYGEMSNPKAFVTNPLNRFIPRGSINKVSYTSVPTKLQVKTVVPTVKGGKTTCQVAYKKTGAKNFKFKKFSGDICYLTELVKKTSYQIKLRYVHTDNASGKNAVSRFSPVKTIRTKG